MTSPDEILQEVGLKATPNRVLVLREFIGNGAPLSLVELETRLDPMERSSILRVLRLLLSHEALHSMEDGRGVTKYELCRGNHHCSPDEMHPHFYCERCGQTFCLSAAQMPHIDAPDGFLTRTINCMLKGICPQCNKEEDR